MNLQIYVRMYYYNRKKTDYHKKNIKFNISPNTKKKAKKKIKLLFENVCGSIIRNLILRKLPYTYTGSIDTHIHTVLNK